MTYVWNIYEPADPHDIGEDPFDIFVYSLRKEEAPLINESVYIEGRLCRVINFAIDHSKSEVYGFGEELYYKVCVI